MSFPINSPEYRKAARARYLAKQAGLPHKCLCGNLAYRRKGSDWVCDRCDTLELQLDSFHQPTWELESVVGEEALRIRRRRDVGPFDPAFHGHRIEPVKKRKTGADQ